VAKRVVVVTVILPCSLCTTLLEHHSGTSPWPWDFQTVEREREFLQIRPQGYIRLGDT
jgi:hypothetical protein